MDALDRLADAGFDLAHAFDAADAARAPGLAWLAGDARLGLLIGNTRALWPAFQAALRDPALAADPDPLDRYTERVLGAAFPGPIYYGHRRYDGAYLPLQRLAALTGLGAIAPNHLVIHPIYGPWFALRAVVVIDNTALRFRSAASPGGAGLVDNTGDPPVRGPIAQPCRCDATCAERFARAERSMDPRDWLAVRTGCALQAWRYSDDQIEYHYARMLRSPA